MKKINWKLALLGLTLRKSALAGYPLDPSDGNQHLPAFSTNLMKKFHLYVDNEDHNVIYYVPKQGNKQHTKQKRTSLKKKIIIIKKKKEKKNQQEN